MKFFVKTFGCQMNVNDSEKMDFLLLGKGMKRAEKPEDADLVIVNSCAVRDKAQQKIFSYIGRLDRSKKIVISGCVAQSEKDALLKKGGKVDFVIGTHQYYRIGEIADMMFSEKKRGVETRFSKEWHEVVPSVISRASSVSGFISIMEGCNNFCTYCIVPFTRGREKYRPFGKIVEEARLLSDKGYKEIILIGQNVNSWKDPVERKDFAQLLDYLGKNIDTKWIRFITSYPGYYESELIEVMKKNRKIARHIHFPVQSGSTEVLKKMGRVYSREKYLQIIEKFKQEIPEIKFSSDFIVGFPGESEADFLQTLSLVREVRFDSIFSFIYSKRKYTKAADLSDDIDFSEKQKRLERLQALQREIQMEDHEKLVGSEIDVLITGKNPKRKGEVLGRSESYKVINFRSENLPGTVSRVKIDGFGPYSLSGTEL